MLTKIIPNMNFDISLSFLVCLQVNKYLRLLMSLCFFALINDTPKSTNQFKGLLSVVIITPILF